MNAFSKVIIVAAGALALVATTASAEIACNGEGECWHVKRHDYHPDLKLAIHPDNWKWGGHEKFRWREHEGHGYWRNGRSYAQNSKGGVTEASGCCLLAPSHWAETLDR